MDDDVLDEEDRLLQFSLAVGDLQCPLVLGELDVARNLDNVVCELLREVLLHVHELICLGWIRLDLNLGGLVAPQVLEHLTIVALDVVPRHLVLLGVDTLALRLHVGVVVAFLMLTQRPLGFDVVGALESWCRGED